MKYDFETLVKRKNVGSEKWDAMYRDNPKLTEDIVPLSVADMEFKNAPEIVDGLKKYLDTSIYGYTDATDAYYGAAIAWMEKRHGFSPEREWFVETAGVVPAIYQMVKAYTEPGDGVLIMPPVYYPFRSAIRDTGRKVVESELVIQGDTYGIDFEDFEQKASREDVKLLILCSPHNPVGRVWSREELLQISEICWKHGVFIIDDEIHFDLILPGNSHVSMGTLEEKYRENCAICTAPSKTFNLAGFQTSNILIPSKTMREKITGSRGYFSLNILGYQACQLAYTKGEAWLEELLCVIDQNRKILEDYVRENLPQLKVFKLQGTYLAWVDFRDLGLEHKELENFMKQKAYWYLDEGYIFGECGKGFERINLACPSWVLSAALERLNKAIRQYL